MLRVCIVQNSISKQSLKKMNDALGNAFLFFFLIQSLVVFVEMSMSNLSDINSDFITTITDSNFSNGFLARRKGGNRLWRIIEGDLPASEFML